MSDLFEKSMRTLELPAVLEMLAQRAVSDEAKERCRRLRPSTEPDAVSRLLDETDAAKVRLGLHGSPSFTGVKDVAQPLNRADHGGMLNTRELLDIAGVLTATRRVSDYDAERQGEPTAIVRLFSALRPNKYLEDRIRGAILDEETIADTASPELADIRRQMRVAATKGRQILQRIISSPSYAKVLQEALITQRDGRFVVPVKAECKGSLPGLVHDVSSSGATLFVEPMGVVQANNEMKELEAKEDKEIDRILRVLSGECAAARETILYNYDVLVQLDAIFARAQLSYAMNAGRPLVRKRGGIDLKKARHPLLDQARAVPVTVELGGRFDTLVITGPNTGGKTVTLKTIGLLSLMAQCGLHIPAGDQSAVQVFDRILADVGDEQSIEQSLSTFSGHMKKITGILELAMPHTLVLLDELGAGTDPAEGAALAVAIIEELPRRGVLLMATTHYAELKVFALETKGVVNASCEFDLETLRPTYKLSVGVPGKSNAFLISEKLGIPERVIEAAQQHLSAEDKRLDAVLGQLDDLKLQLKESQNEVEELKNEASHQLEAAQKKRDELIRQGENELEAARAKARALAQQVESQAYALTDELRQLQKDERMSTQQKAQRAREIAKKESEKLFIGSEAVHNPVKEFVPLKEVKVGQEVCIAELNQLATVLALPDKNGDVLVRAGIIKTKVPLNGLKQPEKLVKEKKPQTKAQQRYSRLTGDANRPNGRVERVQRSAKMECNLLGLTVDEALPEVDSFIDRAILNGQTVVYLIHGNGTGALRTAIHKHLRGNRMVKSFRLGRYGEGESGEAGVTVVELK